MPRSFLRNRSGDQSVTNIELFFDLVYVFAVTQMSHHLLTHADGEGAVQTGILLGLVWLAWAYTTWVTNWLDPDRDPMRLLLIALMVASLAFSAALPEAFEHNGLVVAILYAAMQIGRSGVATFVLRGDALQANFLRITSWCVVSGAVAVIGGLAHGHTREALWILVIAIDLFGGAVGFFTPGLGRTNTEEWTIDGGHFAERCQAFILIALGESVVVIGQSLSDDFEPAKVAAFLTALGGAIALWWVYFDRSGPAGAEVLAQSSDPGKLATSAYHAVHPVMIAGIIVTAAADEKVFAEPGIHPSTATIWMVLGGTALYLAGHALFTAIIWRIVPWTRILAVVVLGLLGVVAPHISALTLGVCTGIVVLAVCVTDRYLFAATSTELVTE